MRSSPGRDWNLQPPDCKSGTLPIHNHCANVKADLRRKYDDSGADEQHHEELAGPDVGTDVAVADRRERDDDEPQRVEQRELLRPAALQVLDTAHAVNTRTRTDRTISLKKQLESFLFGQSFCP